MKKVACWVLCGIIVFTISTLISYKHFSGSKSSSGHVAKLAIDKPTSDSKSKEASNETKNTESQDRPLYSKEVFLTIDDGPSYNNTPKILKTLEDNDVKATFFMIGKSAEELPGIVTMVNNAGMCIGNHSYSHDYKCYKDVETCLDDFNRSNDILERITNKKLKNFIRFPGGSDNQVSNSITMSNIRSTVVEKGFYYIDWNASFGDADSRSVTSQQIISNVMNQCRNNNFIVILMHDAPAKKSTAEALPEVIKYLKENGFVFRTFDDITPTEKNEMIKLRIINRGLK